MTTFKTLYKLNNNNTINQWTIMTENNQYWTEFGQVGGVIQKSLKTDCFGKNKGKKNETTDEEQAIVEAKAIWKRKQEEENFVENIDDVHNKLFNPPMLAKVYDKVYTEDMKFIQPKLDGIRCNMSYNQETGEIIPLSRKNKPFYTTKHIEENLIWFFEQFPTVHLDGELYNHKLHDNFNKIVSLVKKKNITEIDEKEIQSTVKYYVYDLWMDNMPNLTFSQRNAIIKEHLSNIPNVVVVPTYEVNSKETIHEHFINFVTNGYEGAIVRLDKPYEHKRSNNLLKYKEFQDDEFEVIEVNKGKTNTFAESVTIRLKNGNLCNATLAFSDEQCQEILNNKENYIGKLATVRYFGYTNDNLLRFPVVKSFNRNEYE